MEKGKIGGSGFVPIPLSPSPSLSLYLERWVPSHHFGDNMTISRTKTIPSRLLVFSPAASLIDVFRWLRTFTENVPVFAISRRPSHGGLPRQPQFLYSASILVGLSCCCLLTLSPTPRHRAQDHAARLLAPSLDGAILAILDSLALSWFSPMPPGSQLTPDSVIPYLFILASDIHPNLPDSDAPDFLLAWR